MARLHRRDFIAGMAAIAASGCGAPPARVGNRNILLIVADDIGFTDIGCASAKLGRLRGPHV